MNVAFLYLEAGKRLSISSMYSFKWAPKLDSFAKVPKTDI